MKNKIIAILIIISFITGLAQFFINNLSVSTDATAGATQDGNLPFVDQQSGPTINGSSDGSVLIDEITGATITSGSGGVDALTGASLSSDDDHEDDDRYEHVDHEDEDDEDEYEWEFDD